MRYVIRLAFLICCALAGLNLGPAEARRVALVIGNAEHKFVPVLKNPVNDAAAVAKTLEKLKFDKVTLKKDLGFEAFRAALREFSREARDAEAAVVFFAGNGIEVAGRNYLIPVDARLARVNDIHFDAVSLDTVLTVLAGARLGLVILDACRDNPFAMSAGKRGVHRGVSKGLARIEPGHNLFVVYAAAAGTVAEDCTGRHSPFALALLKHLPTPGLELRHLFVRVRGDVMAATGGRQVVEYWDRFNGEFDFKPAQ